MIPVSVRVTYNLERLNRFRGFVRSRSGPIRQGLQDWAEIYRSFILDRYEKFSRGGGSWRPLKPETVKKKGHDLILIDTNTIFGQLNPKLSMTKSNFKSRGLAVQVDVGGPMKHPRANLTVGQLISIHNAGLGVVPKRQIVVKPPPAVQRLMRDAMEKRMLSVFK